MIIDEDQITKHILPGSQIDDNGIVITGQEGYWSNLSRIENLDLINKINKKGPMAAIKAIIPDYFDMIYSPKREASLELLDMKPSSICIDFGCMWGVLSIGAAKRVSKVIAVDQTYESLYFLKKRCEAENIENISCVQGDLKSIKFNNVADYAIVNGVLEWIPITEEVEVSGYFSKRKNDKKEKIKPEVMQFEFMKNVFDSLKDDGKLVLAIENRHSYQYYIGMKDPHANLRFTTFLPRLISNWISFLIKGRPYRNYIYSFVDIKKILIETGFKKVEMYAAFPNYHFPEMILEYSSAGFKYFNRYPNDLRITKKQKLAYAVEIFLMKYLRAKWFSPAIVVVATK
jgi:SAM-dependent methyltransferase